MSKEFARRLTAVPSFNVHGADGDGDDIEAIFRRAKAYEDYCDGYSHGLDRDNATAEQHIKTLALGGGVMMSNTPNSVLLGYIHGKAERVDGEPCPAALSYAHKIGRTEHLQRRRSWRLGQQAVKTGRLMRHEKVDKWTSLSNFLEAVEIVDKYQPRKIKTLNDVVEEALREILSK